MNRVRKLLCVSLAIGFIISINCANASFMEVLNNISATGRTINSVNSATRGTLSTIEYSQRFQDRQQDRQDYKRTQKEYNAAAQDEYYRTIQETRMLENQYNSGAALRVDL